MMCGQRICIEIKIREISVVYSNDERIHLLIELNTSILIVGITPRFTPIHHVYIASPPINNAISKAGVL